MSDEHNITRRTLLAAVAGGSAFAMAGSGQLNTNTAGDLVGGASMLNEANNVAGDLWIGPDSAKSNVATDAGRVYIASDTQVEYYADGNNWIKMGIGSDAESVPSVSTEQALIDHTLPERSTIGNDPDEVRDALEMFADETAVEGTVFTTTESRYWGANAFSSAVYAPTGEIILAPHGADRWGVIDPTTGSFNLSDKSQATGAKYMGQSVLPDGRVVAAPHSADNIEIYDPFSHTVTVGPTHGQVSTAWVGSVLGPDGKAYFVPRNADAIGIFDRSNDSYSDGDTHGISSSETPISGELNAFQGGTLTADGTIVMAPSGYDNIGLYDPSTDTYSDGPIHGATGDRRLVGAVLLADGRVLLVPYDADNIILYDPVDNSATTGAAHGQGDQAFVGGQLLPTGEVLLIPEQASNFGIFDPVDDSYQDGAPHNQGADAYRGSALAPDGSVWLSPMDADMGVVHTFTAPSRAPHATCLHPLIQSL